MNNIASYPALPVEKCVEAEKKCVQSRADRCQTYDTPTFSSFTYYAESVLLQVLDLVKINENCNNCARKVIL